MRLKQAAKVRFQGRILGIVDVLQFVSAIFLTGRNPVILLLLAIFTPRNETDRYDEKTIAAAMYGSTYPQC